MRGHKRSLRLTGHALYAVRRYVILPSLWITDGGGTCVPATMRQRAETHTQRHSALTGTCEAHALTLVSLRNGCTQPLRLTDNPAPLTGVSDDVPL